VNIFAWEVAQGHGLAQLNLTRLDSPAFAFAFAIAFRSALSSDRSSFLHIFCALTFRTVCSFAA